MAVFASPRASLDTICTKIEQIIFLQIVTCSKSYPSTGHKNCARHFPHKGSPKPLYKVNRQDESWKAGQITIGDCDSHVNQPKMKQAFGLMKQHYPVQAGMGEGVLSHLDHQTDSDEVVVSMLGIELKKGCQTWVGRLTTPRCLCMMYEWVDRSAR